MIPFRCRVRDKTHTPIVRNTDIWEYAEALVGDYKPALLKEPSEINVVHFLESYLGATIEYQDIFYNKGESPIAGATVFNDDVIRVFDREGMCTRTIEVSAGTIIIDNATVEKGNKGYEAFTCLHEGGHFSMHTEVYRYNENQICLFDTPKEGKTVVCCRKDTMFPSFSRDRRLTPEQSREHQANVFAAFVAMPRPTFIPFATELIQGAGFPDGIFVYDDTSWECDYALDKVCGDIVSTYGVSYTAARIHLKELDLMMSPHEYADRHSQISIAI